MEVYVRNGLVILSQGDFESVVAKGSQPLLVEGDSVEVWWLSFDKKITKGTVDATTLVVSSVTTVLDSAFTEFSVKQVPDTGAVIIATDGASVVVKVGAADAKTVKTTLNDLTGIDVEIDPSGKSIILSSVSLQQTEQGFVQSFVQAANKVIDQFFVYDYSLGPQPLPGVLSPFWS